MKLHLFYRSFCAKQQFTVYALFCIFALTFGIRKGAAEEQQFDSCNIRLSSTDYDDLLRRNTSAEQRRLLRAIQADDLSLVQKTISRMNAADFHLPNGTTLLTVAIDGGSPAIVKAILEGGADPNQENCGGWPAMLSLETGTRGQGPNQDANLVAIAELLVAHGANIVGKQNREWRSHLLWLAANNGHVELTKWLLEHGATVRDEYNGANALSAAISEDRVDEVKALLKWDAPVNPPNSSPTTPLIEAIQVGDPAIIDLLIEHGAAVNVRRVWGSPLGVAIGRRNRPTHSLPEQGLRDEKIIELLIAAGAKK